MQLLGSEKVDDLQTQVHCSSCRRLTVELVSNHLYPTFFLVKQKHCVCRGLKDSGVEADHSNMMTKWRRFGRPIISVLLVMLPHALAAQEPGDVAGPRATAGGQIENANPLAIARGLGGPASVPGQLQEDRTEGPTYRLPAVDQLFQPWTNVKNRLDDQHRLLLGWDYNSLYQTASETLTGNDDAASGIFRVYGDWTVFGESEKTAGSLIFKGEHRHRYSTAIPPSQIGFDAGYLGIPGVLFRDDGAALTNLYWEQFLCNGNAGFVIGFLEPDAFVDVSGYANPWIAFQNLAVNLNGTIPFPDPVFGAAAGFVLNDQFLIGGGIYDTNNVLGEFEFFPDGAEFFSHIELSWAPSRKERYLKEIHISGWHVDRRKNAGLPESHGVAVGGNWTFGDRWMPFFRFGWSEGGAPLLRKAATAGLLRYFPERGDLSGIAMTWEDPSDKSLNEQNVIEVFYRVQIARTLAITPSIQVIIDPALNPNDEAVTFFGLRARLAM